MTSLEPDVPGEWRWDAACFGQRMFYATFGAAHRRITRSDRIMERDALATCTRCPVLEECESWALGTPEPAIDMVAGGFTPRQRRQIREFRGEPNA